MLGGDAVGLTAGEAISDQRHAPILGHMYGGALAVWMVHRTSHPSWRRTGEQKTPVSEKKRHVFNNQFGRELVRAQVGFGNRRSGSSRCTMSAWDLQGFFLSRWRLSAIESVATRSSFCWSTPPAETSGFFPREPLRVGYRTAKLPSAKHWRKPGQLVRSSQSTFTCTCSPRAIPGRAMVSRNTSSRLSFCRLARLELRKKKIVIPPGSASRTHAELWQLDASRSMLPNFSPRSTAPWSGCQLGKELSRIPGERVATASGDLCSGYSDCTRIKSEERASSATAIFFISTPIIYSSRWLWNLSAPSPGSPLPQWGENCASR